MNGKYGGPVVSITLSAPDKGDKDCPRCLQYKSFFQKKLDSVRGMFVTMGASAMESIAQVGDLVTALRDYVKGAEQSSVDGISECILPGEFDLDLELSNVEHPPLLSTIFPDRCDWCGGSGIQASDDGNESECCVDCFGSGYMVENGVINVDESVWAAASDEDIWANIFQQEPNVLTKELLEKGAKMAQLEPPQHPIMVIQATKITPAKVPFGLKHWKAYEELPEEKYPLMQLDPPTVIHLPKKKPKGGKMSKKCKACDGVGKIPKYDGGMAECPACDGVGWVK